jgi:hypothetical protein
MPFSAATKAQAVLMGRTMAQQKPRLFETLGRQEIVERSGTPAECMMHF